MNKKIRKDIEYKIINKADLYKLANLIYKEYESWSEDRKILTILKLEDDETRELQNVNITEDDIILGIKKLLKITIVFQDWDHDKNITLQLVHWKEYASNYFSIESSNEDWVNSLYVKITEILNSIKPQNIFFLKNKKYLFHILALILGISFISIHNWIIGIVWYENQDSDSTDSLLFLLNFIFENAVILWWLVILFLTWLYGQAFLLLFRFQLSDYIDYTYPSIEFDFWPEHLQKEKKQRMLILKIITIFIVPIWISLLFFYL